MTGYVSSRPPEECYLCGHSHKVMAHWSSMGQNRALCHEDDHSCYTKHNHSQSFDLVDLDQAEKNLNERRKGAYESAKVYEFTEGLSGALKNMGLNLDNIRRVFTDWSLSYRPFGGPTGELKHRLNTTLRGEDPGPPQNWVGLEEYNNVERSKIKWQTKN